MATLTLTDNIKTNLLPHLSAAERADLSVAISNVYNAANIDVSKITWGLGGRTDELERLQNAGDVLSSKINSYSAAVLKRSNTLETQAAVAAVKKFGTDFTESATTLANADNDQKYKVAHSSQFVVRRDALLELNNVVKDTNVSITRTTPMTDTTTATEAKTTEPVDFTKMTPEQQAATRKAFGDLGKFFKTKGQAVAKAVEDTPAVLQGTVQDVQIGAAKIILPKQTAMAKTPDNEEKTKQLLAATKPALEAFAETVLDAEQGLNISALGSKVMALEPLIDTEKLNDLVTTFRDSKKLAQVKADLIDPKITDAKAKTKDFVIKFFEQKVNDGTFNLADSQGNLSRQKAEVLSKVLGNNPEMDKVIGKLFESKLLNPALSYEQLRAELIESRDKLLGSKHVNQAQLTAFGNALDKLPKNATNDDDKAESKRLAKKFADLEKETEALAAAAKLAEEDRKLAYSQTGKAVKFANSMLDMAIGLLELVNGIMNGFTEDKKDAGPLAGLLTSLKSYRANTQDTLKLIAKQDGNIETLTMDDFERAKAAGLLNGVDSKQLAGLKLVIQQHDGFLGKAISSALTVTSSIAAPFAGQQYANNGQPGQNNGPQGPQ